MARRKSGGATPPVNLEPILLGLIAGALALFALNALRFAFGPPGAADVAQLNAMALPMGRLLAWIGGAPEPHLVPAPLRATPLPLLFDWLIWRINPFGLTGLRLAHIVIMLAGFSLLLRALAMRMDLQATALAACVLGLSPRFIDVSVVLGPAPYVLALFCWQLAIVLTRGKIGGPVPLMLFAAVSAAAGLCGIPGILASTSLFIALLVTAGGGADAGRRMLAMLLVLPAWVPPLAFAILNAPHGDPMSAQGIGRLATKIAAHNADLLFLFPAIALATGTALLILLGLGNYLGRLSRKGMGERSHPFALLLIAAAAGSILVFIAGPVLRLYPWTDPAAQAWLALLTVSLAAATFGPRLVPARAAPRLFRMASAVLMLAGAAGGTLAYHYRASWFAPGPETGLMRALNMAGASRGLVYTGANWGRAYFPHAWLMPTDNEQWLLSLDSQYVQHIGPGGRLGDPQPLTTLERYSSLVIARIERMGWRDLSAATSQGAIGAAPPATLEGLPRYWRIEPAQASPGEFWLTTQIMRKRQGI